MPTTDFWNGSGNWTANNSDWSDGTPPISTEGAEIQTGTDTLSATGTISALQIDAPATLQLTAGGNLTDTGPATAAGYLYLQNGASVTTTGSLSITGTSRVALDAAFDGGSNGGSSLTVGGVLTNSSTDNNALTIGNTGITTGDTVTATGLSNTGVINIEGNTSVQSTLNITSGPAGFGTTAVQTGSVVLQNDALLQFASGQITTISGQVDLDGTNARIADTGTLATNSALAGLNTVSGYLYLQNGASVTTTGSLSITGTGRVALDAAFDGGSNGGSSLTVGGVLTNSSTDNNALTIGNTGITTGDTVTATGLSNTGAINIEGNTSVQSTLNITSGPAGFGTTGVQTGSVVLQNDALLQFASGQITSISGQVDLDGTNARIADTGTLATNSALAGLNTVSGYLYLQNGASVTTTGSLSITGTGRVALDAAFDGGSNGGSSLTVGGVLTNSSTDNNALTIGNTGITTGDTVTATGLSNTGVINIEGNTSVQSTLNITSGPAGFGTTAVQTGSVFLQNDALLQFASGQITSISGQVDLDGTNARIADTGTLATNSALAGLNTVSGYLYLQNGASVTTTGSLSITGTGRVALDAAFDGGSNGGSSLTVGGVLTNSSTDNNALTIGNTGITTGDTVTATGLSNTGVINIEGNTSVQSTLNITSGPAGFGTTAVQTGSVFLQNDALLQFASGQITSISGQVDLDGTNARIADTGTLATNSALAGLNAVSGYLYLQNGASVTTTGSLSITGTGRVALDAAFDGGSNGGSSLTVGGVLTNSSTDNNALTIGNTGITTGDTVTATGLSNTGVITIEGNTSVQSTLDITSGPAGFGTTAVQTGSVFLQNDALLQFASGQITTISGQVDLDGTNARIADTGTLAANSALAGLNTVSGYLYLQNGASVTTTGSLSITGTGRMALDAAFDGGSNGGSSLTVGGVLTNGSTDGNALTIGNTGITTGDTVTAAGLSNTGAITIEGNTGVQSTLNITSGPAGFGTTAVQTGSVFLQNDALLQFASGQITTISGQVDLDGTNARIADTGTLATNSALAGLNTVSGYLYLQNGASVTTTGSLSITGTGRMALDAAFDGGSNGGSSLTVGGVLTNGSTDGNALTIGNTGITTGDTVTAAGLSNTGAINIEGNTSVQSTLNITSGPAGFGTTGVQTGSVFLQNDALLQFASGQITTISGQVDLDGTNARIADTGTLATNSALAGLNTVSGYLYLQNGASVTTTGSLSITGTGRVALDAAFDGGSNGGSSLTVGGVLTNSSTDNNALTIGNTGITTGDTVTAAGLSNTGAINIEGNGTAAGVLAVNGSATTSGTVNIDASAEVAMGAGDLYTQAEGSTNIAAGGTLSSTTVDVTGGTLDGTGRVAGTVNNNGGGAVYGGLSLGTPGSLTIGGTYNQSGTGILEANIANGGSSSGVVAVSSGNFVNLTGGTLLVSSTPAVGVLMTVMTFSAGDLIGQFANVQDGTSIGDGSNVNLGDGTTLEVFYNNDSGNIQIERVENTSLATGYTWTDATGNWNTASDWSGGQVPNPTANVVIGNTTTGSVTLNSSSGDTTVNSLSILASNSLTVSGITLTSATGGSGISVASGATLSLSGSGEIDGSVMTGPGSLQTTSGTGILAADTISAHTTFVGQDGSTTVLLGITDNAGGIQINGGGGASGILSIGNSVTLTGGGTVTLDDASGTGNAFLQGNGQTLTNTNNTIQGTGIIGNGSLALINAGVIDATPEGGTTSLTLNGSGGATNTGTMGASAGGVLVINTTVDNANGNITVADATSTVELSGATVQGGTLNNTAGGTLETAGSATLDGSTHGALTITAGSTYTASNNATATLLGSIDNDGTIHLNGGGGENGTLNIGNSATLTGGGTVTLDDASGTGNAFLQGNGQTLTNTNNTIEGTGIIGNGSLVLINGGVIDATPEGGTAILTLNGSGGVTNTSLLEATGGTLTIAANVANTGASITATGAGSVVDITGGVTVTGGTLNTSGTGVMETNAGSSATLQGVTISAGSTYTASNNAATALLGTIDNVGTIQLNGGASDNGDLNIGNAVTLSGAGTVTLNDATGTGNAFVEGNGETLTNTNNTIQGTGIIGNGSLALVNGGVVDATPEGGTATLTLNGSGGVTNTNLLEATSGATLTIATNVTNTGANITAGNSLSVVDITGSVTITGGTLNTSGTGVMETNTGSSATLQGVTISAGSTYTASNNATTTLLGTINNDGTIQLNGGGGENGILSIGNSATLTGGGTVTLDDASGTGNAFLEGNSQTLTNANNTIQGTGIIGNGSLALINGGAIDATPKGGTKTLTLNGSGVTNTDGATGGVLEATAGGMLVISTTVDNANGNITVGDATSTVELSGATVQGGTLNSAVGGTLETAGSATLDGTTQGALTISAGSTYTAGNTTTTTLLGTIDNVGTIQLNGGGGANGDLNIGNAVTLSGAGTVTLNDATGTGNAFVEGNGETLTNTNNTIQGTGIIGNGSLVLINGGVVDATPEGGTATLTLNGSGGVTNTNLLEATSGATLTIATNVTNTGANITAGNSLSVVDITGGVTITGGTLNTSGTGVMETNTGSSATLQGVTISAGSTYTASNNATTTLLGTINNDGTIQLNGGGGENGILSIGNSATLTGGGTVTLDDASGTGNAFLEGNSQTLTNTNNTIQGTGVIGNGSLALINGGVIDATPEVATTTLTLSGSGGVTSTGTMEATGGGTLTLTAGTITNNGLVEAQDSSAVTYTSGASNANNASGVLTGGTWTAIANGHGATVSVTGGAVTTDAATIVLSGTGSVFQAGNGSTFTALENSLTTIASTGELDILDLRNYAAGVGTLANSGKIVLGGGTLSGGVLTIGTTGELTGFGTVTDAASNNGIIDAHGSDLDITTAITGTGKFQIEAGSELELGAATAEAVTYAATTGKLRIDFPATANYTGTINGFAGSDILELAGTNATTATPGSFNGTTTTLTVNLNGGGSLVYTLAGDYSADNFLVTHVNGDADSDITLTTLTSGTPSITAPGTATVGVGQTNPVTGISISESPTTTGETFTAVLTDTNGVLSANTAATGGGGTITPSNGGKTLTVGGTLAQVNADLTTLADTDTTLASDTITVNASDSNGANATQTTTAITVNGLPVITAPNPQTIGVGKAASVGGGSVTETGNTADETFTVTVADTNGLLSATAGAATVTGNASTSLTIKGSLSAVSTALGTLSGTDTTAGTDTITVNASDSFGNAATQTTIAITVNGLPVITAPNPETIGVGKAASVGGGSMTETGNTAGETFTVTVADTNGLLSATGGAATVTGNASTSLTIKGSLSAVSTALGTLSDTDTTAGTDTITVNASDSNGANATQTTTAITVNGLPVITAPNPETIGQGKAASVGGGSVTETGNTAGETFTVTVADTNGLLSATAGAATVTGNASTSLTIKGSLSAVSTALGTLSDTDTTAGTDTITVNASDSFGNAATQTATAITVNGLPAILAPQVATVTQNQATSVSGVSVSESGNTTTSGETFTAVLTDTSGTLAANTTATGGGGSVTPSNGGKTLTISGTLAQVNADLSTLTDDDTTTAADTITVNASDSFGNNAGQQSIAVTVTPASGVLTITAPGTATVGVGQTNPVTGISISESPTTTGETFTAVLTDTNGVLSANTAATGGGGTITPSNGGKTLTVGGTLAQVNADLTTLADTDTTLASDTITYNASDSNGANATQTTTAITVNGLPVITAPNPETIGVGKAASVGGGSLTETGNTAGETFTVTVADTNGLLSATAGAATVTGNASTSLTIKGSLSAVSTALGTLSDTDTTAGTDTITVNASDSFGNAATQTATAITVNGLPVITAPQVATVTQNQATSVSGVSVSESGNTTTSGETFTAVLTDTSGTLAANTTASGGGGSVTPSNGGKTLTISGTLAQVNADLSTLTDDDTTTAADTITVNASDSFGNSAGQQSIAVTVTPATGGSPPTISGAMAGQVTTDESAIKPLSGVVLADSNPGANDTVTLTLTNGLGTATDANGALAGAGLIKTGIGTYLLAAGPPTTVSNALDALVFMPTAHETAPGQTITTGITIAVNDSLFTVTNMTTSIVATAVNDAPVIAGTKARQTTTDYVPIKPFLTASVTDADVGVDDSLTITLINSLGGATDANGTLSGAGLTKIGLGTYSLTATTPALLTNEIQALTFTPTQHEVSSGKTVTTSFVLIASQTAGGSTMTASNATTSVVVTALNYIYGPRGGFGYLIGTPGQDVITAYGSHNVIFGEGGPDFINAGNGEALVNIGNGSATVTLGGPGNFVEGGNGNVTVTGAPGGDTSVILANGNHLIEIGGRGDLVVLGNGTNTISGTQGMAFIATGSGNDTITVGGVSNTVNAGGGTNVINGGTGDDTFVLPPASVGFDTITGFSEANGDMLDLRAALAATTWNGRSASLGNYLKVTDSGGNATLSIAPTGSGAGIAIAKLVGSGNLALADLLSHHSLLT